MTFFETLLVLGAVAVVLLQVARRIGLPYPSMLAAAGMGVAAIPGAPTLPIAPSTALALFIAPVLVDAAFDFPLATARKLIGPLLVYAVLAVLLTAGVVVAIGHFTIGLPIAAALTLGAIVGPPDAAAATAVISSLPVSRRVDSLLKGESLFNDATALLLFDAALTIQMHHGLDLPTEIHLGLAVPGGILFGIAYGLLVRRLSPHVENTVGGTLLQFLHAFATWIIAERLHLSAVLATVASSMTIARAAGIDDSPRMRTHSYAVWTTVVFLLNVLAFLLMGMQVRQIVGAMDGPALVRAGWFAAAIVGGVIATRLVVAFGYRAWITFRHRHGGRRPIEPAETLLIGWAGMRGLVTLATAFALPAGFPDREAVVLAAFAVVVATLVIQGSTLVPLIRWFGVGRETEARDELEGARATLAAAALERLENEPGEEAEALRRGYRARRDAFRAEKPDRSFNRHRGLARAAIVHQRRRLLAMRAGHEIGPTAYLELQEELDWKELALLSDEDRRIDEN